jgi:hypothetical protein
MPPPPARPSDLPSRFSLASVDPPAQVEPGKKFSRFSEMRKLTSVQCLIALNPLDLVQKRKKFLWRDATEEELKEQCRPY